MIGVKMAVAAALRYSSAEGIAHHLKPAKSHPPKREYQKGLHSVLPIASPERIPRLNLGHQPNGMDKLEHL